VIGAAFSKTRKEDEKRNVIIFVRPHIIRSEEDYQKITQNQEDVYRKQANARNFDAGIDLVNPQNIEKLVSDDVRHQFFNVFGYKSLRIAANLDRIALYTPNS